MVEAEQSSFNSIELDLGRLTAFDLNPVDTEAFADDGESAEKVLLHSAQKSTKVLMDSILSLPREKTEDEVLLLLPKPWFELPRAKPLPKEKPKSKWQQFADKKGIKKKHREGKLVYDEQSGEWVPSWGYKGKNKDAENQWLVELKENDNSTEDPRTAARKERLGRSKQHAANELIKKAGSKLKKRSSIVKMINRIEKKSRKVRSHRK